MTRRRRLEINSLSLQERGRLLALPVLVIPRLMYVQMLAQIYRLYRNRAMINVRGYIRVYVPCAFIDPSFGEYMHSRSKGVHGVKNSNRSSLASLRQDLKTPQPQPRTSPHNMAMRRLQILIRAHYNLRIIVIQAVLKHCASKFGGNGRNPCHR